MCYVIAKNFNSSGCLAYKAKPGKDLADMTMYLTHKTINNNIQILIVGDNLDIYGEYKPYNIVNNKQDFINKVLTM